MHEPLRRLRNGLSNVEMSDVLNSVRTRSTLHDVAEAAGVSPTTVSLVLAGKAGKRRISEATDGRVRIAAERLGYTPNLLQRSLRRGRTHVISFYNAYRNREWSDLYMDRMAAAIEHAGGSEGYDVLAHCNFQRDTQETFGFLTGGFADGLVLFNPATDEPLVPLLRSSGVPTVLIDPRDTDTGLSSVYDDEETGMRLVSEALLGQGHRRVAAVVERTNGVLDPTGRLARLRRHFAAEGLEIAVGSVALWNGSPSGVLAQVLSMSARPTALFVWHDRAAYAILEACAVAGVSVPQDLSIVGYDGLIWPSKSPHVVSSVHVALDRIGRAAVATLHRLIEGEPGPLTETIAIDFFPGTTLGPPSR
ncbi:LacI family DNA-binding transcriptional regulator [soil metagenome]